MNWTPLRTDYTDAKWNGLKKYRQVTNSDGTVSFIDVTQYTEKENSFFKASDANAMNGAINELKDASFMGAIVPTLHAPMLTLSDTAEAPLKRLTVYGKSTQDGTPSPSAPVEIASVNNPNVWIGGKNLIPKPTGTTWRGITYTVASDGTITANGTATGGNAILQLSATNDAGVWNRLYQLNQRHELYLSGCPSGGSTNTYDIQLWQSVGGSLADTGNGFVIPKNKMVTGVDANLSIVVREGTTVNNIVFKPQLEIGSARTPYEPYRDVQSKTLPPTIGGASWDRVLRGIKLSDQSGDYYTYIDADGNKWIADEIYNGKYIKRIYNVTLSPNFNWTRQYVGGWVRFYSSSIQHLTIAGGRDLLCTHFAHGSHGAGKVMLNDNDDAIFWVTQDESYTLDNWRAFLTANSVVFTAVMREPQETVLTESEIAYLTANSYYPSTSIWSDKDGELGATYIADPKNYIDGKVAQMQTAIASLEG